MTENGVYTHLEKSEIGHDNFTDIQLANPEEITVSTDNDQVHFTSGGRNGPWPNQARNANSSAIEKSTFSSTTEPFSGRTFYIFIIVGSVLFIVGLIMGVLIGRFAMNNSSNTDPLENYRLSSQSGQRGNKNENFSACTCTSVPPARPTTVKAGPNTNPINCTYPSTTPSPTVTETCSRCTRRNPVEESDVQSPFSPLTATETQNVIRKINSEGLTGPGSSLGNNYIDYIYLLPGNKSSVLKYLDNGEAFPARYAKVHITRGTANPPDVMIYKIGPVNETVDAMTVEKLLQDGEIHFNRRSYDSRELYATYSIIRRNLDRMKKMLKESFDGAYYRHGLAYSCSTLHSLEENDRRSGCYLYMSMATGGSTLRILPVSFILHHPGINTSVWYTSDYYYLNQGPFASSRELVIAYSSGSLRKIKIPQGYRTRYAQEFSLIRNTSLPLRENSDIPPPRTFEPKGPRYTIKANVIFWMDWEFEFFVDPIRGPAIFNVKFKGTRIAYEISLQDITLVYASGTTGAGVVPPILSDTEFSLGGNLRGSRPGFGCPERASLLYANVYKKTHSFGENEVACVFEADPQRPMWRHYKNGLVDHHLVVRSPMNLGNYDYTLEFRFYLDGKIEGISASSGTLYGAFWDPDDPLLDNDKSLSPFGFRVGQYLSGPIHSHDFLFKVDLDILGTHNSFQKVNWKGGDVLSALKTQRDTKNKPGFFPFNHTRYIEFEFLDKEDGLLIDPLNPSYWTVVNENENNNWGVKRGYRIIPTSSAGEPESFTQHLVFEPWLNMKYHCAVTKRKESELYGTESIYDIRRPTDSRGGLAKMMDDENIRNEDLVLWVNAKFIHAPTSEDVPMTIGVDKGFVLKPFNYFDTTPTFDVQGHYDASEPYEKVSCSDL